MSASDTHANESPAADKLAGISGWLAFPAFGSAAAPFVLGLQLFEMLPAIGRMAEVPVGIAAFVSLEIAVNAVLVVLSIYSAYCFFSRRRNAPKVFITLLLASLAFQVLDAVIAKLAFDTLPDAESVKGLLRIAIGCAVWVPYFLVSKRVKATFTR